MKLVLARRFWLISAYSVIHGENERRHSLVGIKNLAPGKQMVINDNDHHLLVIPDEDILGKQTLLLPHLSNEAFLNQNLDLIIRNKIAVMRTGRVSGFCELAFTTDALRQIAMDKVREHVDAALGAYIPVDMRWRIQARSERASHLLGAVVAQVMPALRSRLMPPGRLFEHPVLAISTERERLRLSFSSRLDEIVDDIRETYLSMFHDDSERAQAVRSLAEYQLMLMLLAAGSDYIDKRQSEIASMSDTDMLARYQFPEFRNAV